MPATFIEPGGDATFNVATPANGGFWQVKTGAGASVYTDFVHGSHRKSIGFDGGSNVYIVTPNSVVSDAGGRISTYAYFQSFPAAGGSGDGTEEIFGPERVNDGTAILALAITSGGVLRVTDANGTQFGSDGPTLNTARWYRLSLAYTITSSTVNEIRVFVDGVLAISASNVTLGFTTSSCIFFGHFQNGSVYRINDIYVDNSSSLLDTGDIWVTAKRPNANGASNQFTTQIGSGGSGYGSGHSPQVNERALSTTNGWSIQSASKQTEEYSIETRATGDMDISYATIIDFVGWVYAKVGVNSTGNIIVAGSASNISVTTAYSMFTKFAGSSTYPGGNTDIGMDTNTVNQLFSLAECGIIVAFIPAAAPQAHVSNVPGYSFSFKDQVIAY